MAKCDHLYAVTPDYKYGNIHASDLVKVVDIERESKQEWFDNGNGLKFVRDKVEEELKLQDLDFFKSEFTPYPFCPLCGCKNYFEELI